MKGKCALCGDLKEGIHYDEYHRENVCLECSHINLRIDGWLLVEESTGEPVDISKSRTDFRGDKYLIVGGRPPHKPSSSGFVRKVYDFGDTFSEEFEYYATTADAKWVHEDDEYGRGDEFVESLRLGEERVRMIIEYIKSKLPELSEAALLDLMQDIDSMLETENQRDILGEPEFWPDFTEDLTNTSFPALVYGGQYHIYILDYSYELIIGNMTYESEDLCMLERILAEFVKSC